ncbi:hypothetical protein KKH63_02570, partial [Patescibacteria group bacterium]|nr:hypothetical protein [Patescibacteria group bacterium]
KYLKWLTPILGALVIVFQFLLQSTYLFWGEIVLGIIIILWGLYALKKSEPKQSEPAKSSAT